MHVRLLRLLTKARVVTLALGLVGLIAGSVLGQDTTRTLVDTSAISDQEAEEQILTVISIVAVVEKPSVAIMPRRVKPEFESAMFFDRSFDRELKEVPAKLLSLDEELESAKKITKLRKLVVKGSRE